MQTIDFLIFIGLKLLLIAVIFSKAWHDVKGNKTQFDHIITVLPEFMMIALPIYFSYFNYNSPVLQDVWMLLPSYILLRHAFFDSFWNRLRGMSKYHLDSDDNNILDRPKKWMLKVETKYKFPLLTLSRFVAGFLGVMI